MFQKIIKTLLLWVKKFIAISIIWTYAKVQIHLGLFEFWHQGLESPTNTLVPLLQVLSTKTLYKCTSVLHGTSKHWTTRRVITEALLLLLQIFITYLIFMERYNIDQVQFEENVKAMVSVTSYIEGFMWCINVLIGRCF